MILCAALMGHAVGCKLSQIDLCANQSHRQCNKHCRATDAANICVDIFFLQFKSGQQYHQQQNRRKYVSLSLVHQQFCGWITRSNRTASGQASDMFQGMNLWILKSTKTNKLFLRNCCAAEGIEERGS